MRAIRFRAFILTPFLSPGRGFAAGHAGSSAPGNPACPA
jgi:hypothetical protein